MTRLTAVLFAVCVVLALAVPPAVHAQMTAPATPPSSQPPTQAPPTGPPPEQPTQSDDKESIEAAKQWLALIDSDKAGTAWDTASKQLQSVVKRDRFISEMRSVRKPLGKLASRTPVKFARSHELPGAPSGDYTIIEFDAKFVNGKRLTEQLIWTAEEGSVWRVAGYFYR